MLQILTLERRQAREVDAYSWLLSSKHLRVTDCDYLYPKNKISAHSSNIQQHNQIEELKKLKHKCPVCGSAFVNRHGMLV